MIKLLLWVKMGEKKNVYSSSHPTPLFYFIIIVSNWDIGDLLY